MVGVVLAGALAVHRAEGAAVTLSLQQLDRNNVAAGTLGVFDLTQGGDALDWIKVNGTPAGIPEKDATTILTYSTLGSVTGASYTNDGYTFTWNGGTATNPSGSNFTGVNDSSSTIGRGFRISFAAPAAGDYTLTLYGAANGLTTSGVYSLAAKQGASTLQSLATGTNLGSDSVDELVWTAHITADSTGQSFDFDYTRALAINGAIAFTGVTVVAAPEPASASIIALAALSIGCLKRRKR